VTDLEKRLADLAQEKLAAERRAAELARAVKDLQDASAKETQRTNDAAGAVGNLSAESLKLRAALDQAESDLVTTGQALRDERAKTQSWKPPYPRRRKPATPQLRSKPRSLRDSKPN
jgi:predicted  nucleic acid-binding Zn-ribbon protein